VKLTNTITRYIIDDLILDIERGELFRQNKAIALPKLSYDLLLALADSAPALLSQAQIMQKVWPDRVIGDETIKQRVKLLRKALNDDASAPSYIEAVRGRGYRLLPEVTRECVVNSRPAVMLDLAANDLFPSFTPRYFSRLWYKFSFAAFVLVVLLMASIITSRMFYPQNNLDHNEEKATQDPISAEQKETLAANTTLLKAERYYQRGQDYYHRYREQDNDIAMDFYNKAIKLKSDYSDAYAGLSQAYSQKYYQFKGNEQDKKLAIDNAYLAITYDGSAQAFKALGNAYYVSSWLSKSINVLIKAFSKNNESVEIASNIGFIYSEQGQFVKALTWHKKAVQLDENYAGASLHSAITLQRIGAYELAHAWYEKTINLQPDYMLAIYHWAQLHIEQKNYQQAERMLQAALSKYPRQTLLAEALADSYYLRGLQQEALSAYKTSVNQTKTAPAEKQKNAQFANNKITRAEVMVLLLNKNHSEIAHSEQHLQQLLALGDEKPQTSLLLAQIFAHQQKHQFALRYLIQAIEQGFKNTAYLYQLPDFTALVNTAQIQRTLLAIEQQKHEQRLSLRAKLLWFNDHKK
jgi:DNA-binding winged helix-turn-helix (wHTH) protein/Flp pilus assembly protein TadD